MPIPPRSGHLLGIIIPQKSQRSNSKFVEDQWNASHDSLVHVCSLSPSSFGKKSTFFGITILIFFACPLRHGRVMTGYYVTLKYQAKPRTIAWEVFATFKVTRFYLIKQNNWTSGTYSIEISTWSYENRVSKHFVIFPNFPCLTTCLSCCLLMSFFFACLAVRELWRSGCRQNYYLIYLLIADKKVTKFVYNVSFSLLSIPCEILAFTGQWKK